VNGVVALMMYRPKSLQHFVRNPECIAWVTGQPEIPVVEETGISKTGSRFYAGSGTIPIQNMVLSRTSMSVYGCQTFGLVAQGGVPIRLSAVRTRGSQEAGCRSRGVEFAPDSPLEERVSSEPVSENWF
jgi:hypothetical protein